MFFVKFVTRTPRHTPAINVFVISIPAKTGIYSFRSICPGTDVCDKNMDIFASNTDYSVCLPSSVKRIFDAGVVSISASLVVQALSAVLLYLRKGTRLVHQALCAVVVVGLITSVSTFLSGPTRLQSLCFNIPSGVSVKAVVSPGGVMLPSKSFQNPVRCGVSTDAFHRLAPRHLHARPNFLPGSEPLSARSVGAARRYTVNVCQAHCAAAYATIYYRLALLC
jgi:hypothetical protein